MTRSSCSSRAAGSLLRVPAVAIVEQRAAELGEAAVGRLVLRAGIAVAEVAGQVEAEPLGEPTRLVDRLGMIGEALGHRLGRREHVRGVAAPARLGLVERRPEPHREEGVLERRPRAVVHVDVAGGDARHPEPLGELGEQAVATTVAACERPLKLDPEAIRPERAQETARDRRGGRVLRALDARGHGAASRAAREADEAIGVALDLLEAHPRRLGSGRLARALVGLRDQAAEVAVPRPVLAEEREVVAVVERQLGARDRADAERPRRAGELHGAVQAVVVGQGERRVALLSGGRGQLDRMRRSVEEREGRMAVELDVGQGERMFAYAEARWERVG